VQESVDLSKIPQLDGWIADGGDFDPRTFLLSSVTIGEAAAMSLLLWPEFTEYRSCVFLRFLFDTQAIDKWFGELKGDGRAVESVVNHLHLWDVFAPKTEPEYVLVSELAPKLGEMWMAALKRTFSSREFVVSVTSEANDYGPTVSFRSA